MKKLETHIEELIVKYDCVIVPDLGGFITGFEGAKLRDDAIVSPRKYIRFNNLLTYNDGLLTEVYMKERGVGYAEAIDAIKTDVAVINSRLAQEGKYQLGKIGTLYRLENGNTILKDLYAGFLPENFGVPAIKLSKLSPAIQPAVSPIAIQRAAEKKGVTISLDLAQALKYAAMIAAVLLLSITVPNKFENATNHASISFDSLLRQNISAITPISYSSAIEEPQATNETQPTEEPRQEIGQKQTEEQKQKQESGGALPTESLSSGKYHLIIASLPDNISATDYISSHKSNGFEMQVIEKDGKYRISAARFNSYKKAIQYLENVRVTQPKLKKSWIMCN